MDEGKTSKPEGNMLKTLYSVYDKKSQIYSAPFIEVNDGTAIRAIQDTITNNQSHPFARHGEDFELCRVGSFNELDGGVSEDPQGTVIQIEQLTGE
jgi:hypothetical protein